MSDERMPRDTATTVDQGPATGGRHTFEGLAFREGADQPPDRSTDAVETPDEQSSAKEGTAAMAAVSMAEPSEEARPGESAPRDDERATPLFDEGAAGTYRQRWQDVQSRFVDDPRKAVTEADVLVADLMQTLAKTFADERARLEETWRQGGNASTEELRIALQRYRSFFGRLLSV